MAVWTITQLPQKAGEPHKDAVTGDACRDERNWLITSERPSHSFRRAGARAEIEGP